MVSKANDMPRPVTWISCFVVYDVAMLNLCVQITSAVGLPFLYADCVCPICFSAASRILLRVM